MAKKKKTKKPVNKFLAGLASMVMQSESWAEFNIKLLLNGSEFSPDMLLALIHFAFASVDPWKMWSMSDEQLAAAGTLRDKARRILVGACEDPECKFSDEMADTFMKKTIFDRDFQNKIPSDVHRRMICAIARKNPKGVKAAYARYSTFAKYKV